jgi:hypothetical protein
VESKIPLFQGSRGTARVHLWERTRVVDGSPAFSYASKKRSASRRSEISSPCCVHRLLLGRDDSTVRMGRSASEVRYVPDQRVDMFVKTPRPLRQSSFRVRVGVKHISANNRTQVKNHDQRQFPCRNHLRIDVSQRSYQLPRYCVLPVRFSLQNEESQKKRGFK